MDLSSLPLTELRGISAVRQKLFSGIGVYSIQDLLEFYPRTYEDRGHVKTVETALDGEHVSLVLTVNAPLTSHRIRGGKARTVQQLVASDDTGVVKITFFNRPFLKDTFTVGRTFRFFGILTYGKYGAGLSSPTFEPVSEDADLPPLVPVYSLCAGLTAKLVSDCVRQALEKYKSDITETLEEELMAREKFLDRYHAFRNIHFPDSDVMLIEARRRLAFEEMYRFYIRTASLGKKARSGQAYRIHYPDMRAFTAKLPFELTMAQKYAIQDILKDMTGVSSPDRDKENLCQYVSPARRLVQGDVGCGKTMVAAAAVYAVCLSGCQAALMVPTSILARQHYAELGELLSKFGIKAALLVGGMKPGEKKQILEEIADGTVGFVVGTHALIEENVLFDRLALAITDEQHRFGVMQRKALEQKASQGIKPHTVVMSATPIPRTLAMILYCDLNISLIDQMPKGRIPVETYAVGTDKRKRVYSFIGEHVAKGYQAYILCPLAEENSDNESDKMLADSAELNAAKEYSKALEKTVLGNARIAYLHGKMKPAEKEKIMQQFADGEIDVLVSTTVIEVGVNVPNATVMFIENAERFGLAQLHQLRGRVGRGKAKAFCILMSPLLRKRSADSPFAKRMDILCKSTNGFEIAEKDLELRGPGEFFGLRQSGELNFRLVNPVTDADILRIAKDEAERVLLKYETTIEG